MNKIKEALNKRFSDHRIIFWYDEKGELREQFEELKMPNIEKMEVQGNEFEVKHRVNKVSPKTKFLLYLTGEKPANEENWLLDMELAHHVFHTDQEAMFLQELGLEYHFKELVTKHIEFFKSKERRNKLRELLGEGDEEQEILYKMLAVLFATENVNLATYIHAHASAFSDGNEKIEKELLRYNLKDYYWNEINRKYNYQSDSPAIYDFLLEVFNNNFVLGKNTGLAKESRLLLSVWKDTIQYRESFAKISDKVTTDLGVEEVLETAAIDEIVADNLFKLTDRKIIHELVSLLASESIPSDKILQYAKKRENKFWHHNFENFYQSIVSASEMINLIRKYADTRYTIFEEGVNNYADKLFEIDLLYRKFIWNYRKTKQDKILAELAEKVEKVYSNDWLLTYNNNWQKVIDKLSDWPNRSINSQQQFFDIHVKPFIEKQQRLFVIISDALRYECGTELSKNLQAENRYESSIENMIGCLPSYTQLGMASLLPHKELALKEESDLIIVDGMSSSGRQGRTKILEVSSGVRSTAIKAEDLMRMNSATVGRDYVKKFDLIYIYNDRIDKAGETSEERVFEAVEDEIQFLMDLVKKISNMNGNNVFITSDHGFIYQHQELDESDFSVSKHKGEVWKENRRFVIGKGLKGDAATKSFTGKELNLNSDVDVLIPKSINRLRVRGAGSRFIHGGSSLQEIVIPLIKVSKQRKDTTSQVEVDIIKSTDRITTNILAVSFIQADLVTDIVLPRTIRAGIYAEDGILLSDQFNYVFDIDEGSERQREVKHRFQLSAKASGIYKNQRVKLIMEEPVEGSSKWKQYKDYHYTLNISFTNDFDEF